MLGRLELKIGLWTMLTLWIVYGIANAGVILDFIHYGFDDVHPVWRGVRHGPEILWRVP